MSNINITTTCKRISADLYTPVGIYLRMRDRFRDTILLESTDSHAGENSRSVIAVNAIGGVEVTELNRGEYKYPGQQAEPFNIKNKTKLPDFLDDYMGSFDAEKPDEKVATIAQGLFGYMSYDAVQFFENITLESKPAATQSLPVMRYRLYQYVIIVDHFKDEILLCENRIAGVESRLFDVESILKSKDAPVFPFSSSGSDRALRPCSARDRLP